MYLCKLQLACFTWFCYNTLRSLIKTSVTSNSMPLPYLLLLLLLLQAPRL
jgi:hypothetical protein